MNSVLILIDIQNDFITGELPVPDGRSIIEPVNQLIPQFSHVIATQDWHPGNHFSFFTLHAGKKAFESITKDNYQQTLWPPHCVQGSEGANFFPELHTKAINAIFRKGTNPDIDSYSAFFDNQKLKETGLDGYLKGLHLDELHFAGLAADYCVYYSMIDALNLGYKVFLHEHCTRAISKDQFENQKKELTTYPNFTLLP